MSLELENSELFDVQIELNCLTELSSQINNCQNNMRDIQYELKTNFERNKKCLLDFRLKFGKKIDEAKHYYRALSDLETEQIKEEKLRYQLIENQQKLDKILSEISSDISELKRNQIKYFREKINEIKLNLQFISVQCISKTEILAKIKSKYNRSIEQTKDYFSIKLQSTDTSNQLKELLNGYQEDLISYKQQYSQHMLNLEKLSTEIHLQRSTQNLVDSRLSQPLPNCEYLSIPSYDLEDDEKYEAGFDEDHQSIGNYSEDGGGGSLSNQLSHSQSHLINQSIFSNESALPSPCKSINLPLGYTGGMIINKSKNISWHPLL